MPALPSPADSQGRGVSREQKLGLIAGFTVVLFFGVLLADHLSRARADTLLISDPIDEPLVIPPIEVPSRVGSSLPARPRVSIAEPTTGGGVLPREPVVINPGVDAEQERVASADLPARIRSIFEPVPGREGPVQRVDLPGFDPVEDTGSARVVEPAPVTTTAERGRTHEVKQGESLFQISERYYGNGHLWRELAAHNRDRVGEDGGVGIGVVLTIPPRGTVAGGKPARVAVTAEPTEERTYTVKAGDTLSEISQKLLGSAKRMDELVTMNRDQIRDADDIRVGMKLRYRPGPSA